MNTFPSFHDGSTLSVRPLCRPNRKTRLANKMAAGVQPQPATAEQPMSRQDNRQIEEHTSDENDKQVPIKREQSSPSSSPMPRESALQDITAKVTNVSLVQTLVAQIELQSVHSAAASDAYISLTLCGACGRHCGCERNENAPAQEPVAKDWHHSKTSVGGDGDGRSVRRRSKRLRTEDWRTAGQESAGGDDISGLCDRLCTKLHRIWIFDCLYSMT